jgi:hypothetical protein
MEAAVESPPVREGRRGIAAGVAGLASLVLLGACVRWAHHWGLRADVLVAAWASTAVASVALAWRPLRRAEVRPFTRLAVWCAVLTLLALATAGAAFAAGYDAAAACGGG